MILIRPHCLSITLIHQPGISCLLRRKRHLRVQSLATIYKSLITRIVISRKRMGSRSRQVRVHHRGANLVNPKIAQILKMTTPKLLLTKKPKLAIAQAAQKNQNCAAAAATLVPKLPSLAKARVIALSFRTFFSSRLP